MKRNLAEEEAQERTRGPVAKYWTGSPPASCDVCKGRIEGTFIDGATRSGRWANMCSGCHLFEGGGRLGTGRGQKYEKQDDGRWLKVGG